MKANDNVPEFFKVMLEHSKSFSEHGFPRYAISKIDNKKVKLGSIYAKSFMDSNKDIPRDKLFDVLVCADLVTDFAEEIREIIKKENNE